MGRAARDLGTVLPHEQVLGRMLFDRYPHLVPSPGWISSLGSLVGDLDDGPQRRAFAQARPLQVLEAWFDCWAALAFRDATPDCRCTTHP